MTVIFIGGASASGKTAAARRLAGKLQLPVLGLDTMADLLRPVLPERSRRVAATHRLAHTLVAELVQGGANAIVEGGWLRPLDAAALREAGLVAAYCGYVETTGAERLQLLRASSAAPHWLTTVKQDWALRWIEQQIADSRWYREECARLGLAYADCSRIEEGIAGLCREVESLLATATTARAQGGGAQGERGPAVVAPDSG
jgi:predicted kinase